MSVKLAYPFANNYFQKFRFSRVDLSNLESHNNSNKWGSSLLMSFTLMALYLSIDPKVNKVARRHILIKDASGLSIS